MREYERKNMRMKRSVCNKEKSVCVKKKVKKYYYITLHITLHILETSL